MRICPVVGVSHTNARILFRDNEYIESAIDCTVAGQCIVALLVNSDAAIKYGGNGIFSYVPAYSKYSQYDENVPAWWNS